jgi:hypothetical protein
MTKKQQLKKTGIKSKERVKRFAEVYTPGWCVSNMLDMLKEHGEAFRTINETFLDPCCGDGRFPIQMLERKMYLVDSLYPTKEEYKTLTIIALSKIYCVDIQADNVQECKDRLLRSLKSKYLKRYNERLPEDHEKNLRYILDTNIMVGNFLTLLDNDNRPLIVCDYEYNGDHVIRSDYYFSDIQKDPKNNKPFRIHDKVLIKDISTLGGVNV